MIEEAVLAKNELKEWRDAAAKKSDVRKLKCGEEERKKEGGRMCRMSFPLEGCRGGGSEEEEEEGGRAGSLTSARLEPQWLARIQPHCAFDEG